MAETRFRKGDRVKFHFVNRPVQGIVKEDRGPIGIKGRRLYLIEFPIESTTPVFAEIELPAERLTAVNGKASKD